MFLVFIKFKKRKIKIMVKVGDIVIVKANSNGHSYMIGGKYRVHQLNGDGSFRAVDPSNGWMGNSLTERDVEVASTNKAYFKKRMKQVSDELFMVRLQLEYMEESNKDDYLENDFFAWYIVKLINSDDKDKEKKLSKIINTMSNNVNLDILKHTF